MDKRTTYSGMIPNTVEGFAKCCAGLTPDQIYDLFENKIRVNRPELHSAIYSWAPEGCNEPFRAACDALGAKYHVKALQEY